MIPIYMELSERANVVASAIIDRLVHHASIFYITGSSYRLKNKLKKAN